MTFHVLTLFPEMIEQGLKAGVIGRALEKHIISLRAVNIRDYTRDKHGRVDDYPYGGGAGMLLQAQPVYDAHRAVCGGRPVRTVYVTPQGRPFDQRLARELAREEELILLCGHYEGVDERALEEVATDRVSIGDYILTGGELPAMVIVDAVARLIPGVLGNETSAREESFDNDLLEYPQYTRPRVWRGKEVPQALLSGDHRLAGQWRLEQSLERTKSVRPRLYERYRQRQALIWRLSREKRTHIHMMEGLSRGLGDILYENGDTAAVYLWESRVCMACAADEPDGLALLSRLPQEARLAVVHQAFMKKLLEERGFESLFSCRQFVYTQRTPLPVRHKDIRPLGMESFDYLCAHYGMEGPEYVRERLLSGAVYGAFWEGRLAGFIGVHREGVMGMLYVDEAHRRKGLAASLEAYLINRTLERGFTPYVQAEPENLPSLGLQEKLGLYQARPLYWWMERRGFSSGRQGPRRGWASQE